ncbi:hypothetical protein E2C01_045993 [Portunus trituberculatus]|uniref:Uncharacterized protein n=1 Tax=Portunus trituberculatus TaxID=210409 RepID=A0A5B7FZR3_PORTR|nr:hypothetical protein [Portunus trituberculatus]
MDKGDLLRWKIPSRKTKGASRLSLLVIEVMVRRSKVRALVDTGRLTTVLTSHLVPGCDGEEVMTRILKTVLGKRKTVEAGMSSYIDGILVAETVVTTAKVVEHLTKFGLVMKPTEPLEGGAALGIKLQRDKSGELIFQRRNEIWEVEEELSRRELFSACGRLPLFARTSAFRSHLRSPLALPFSVSPVLSARTCILCSTCTFCSYSLLKLKLALSSQGNAVAASRSWAVSPISEEGAVSMSISWAASFTQDKLDLFIQTKEQSQQMKEQSQEMKEQSQEMKEQSQQLSQEVKG